MLDLSCPDWRERLKTGRSLLPAMPLREDEAKRAVGIYNRLRLPDVPGQPPLAEAGAPWFREIVATLFGATDDADQRLVREVFLLVPKKNSKTTNGAALMLTALLANRRPRAEFLLIGPTQAIAALALSQAIGMIEADPEGVLQKRLHIRDNIKEIQDRRTKATLRIKTFDSAVLTGVKPVGVLIDELHELGKVPDAARVIGQIRGGLLPNAEGFLCFITTQSDAPPAGVFREELRKARDVRDGRLKAPILPVLYEFPEEMQRQTERSATPAWMDPANWWMVTPNRGRSIDLKRLEQEFGTARASGVEELARWASQHLNVELGIGLRTDRWRGADFWGSAEDPGLTFEEVIARAEVLCVGIDGGGLDDLLAIAVLGRDATTKDWLLWTRAWAHEGVLDMRKSEAARLRDLERDGDLGIVANLDDARAELCEIAAEVDRSGKLAMVGLDPMGVGAIVDDLAERGISGDRVVGVSQGWTLNGAIKTVETKLASGSFWHAGQPLMAWAVGNAKVEPKGNAITITKQVNGTGKIDPLIATFTATALMSKNPAPRRKPSYAVYFV
jgi:phage terminase large subunit-like protein